MTASINDVARAAGVSASTVSRALRGRAGVSDEVRDRIAAVAAQLGYTASRSASSLASGRTFTIGVVVPYVGRWFFGTVLDAAEQVFSAAGYDVLLYNLGTPETRKRFFAKLPVRKRVDAVLSLLIPDEGSPRRCAPSECRWPARSAAPGPASPWSASTTGQARRAPYGIW